MSETPELLQNPLFRLGVPVTTSVMILLVAFLVVEDQTVRLAMIAVAVADVIVTPQVLKRAAKEA